MIFVTTGTTYAFDSLIREIDRIAPFLKERVVIQTGPSKVRPKNCDYFDFKKDLSPYIRRARLVIAHGGAGSSFEILSSGKRLISVENPEVNDKHQWDLLARLEKERFILWCRYPEQLMAYIHKSKTYRFSRYVKPKCTIHKRIIEFLEGSR